MRVGVSTIDITPQVGIELQGFAAREQPSTSISDRLHLKVLLIEQEGSKFLWCVFDLLGLSPSFVREIRKLLELEFQIPASQLLLTATHTHSGPPTICLNECGEYDESYINSLPPKLTAAVQVAHSNLEECDLYFTEGHCTLGHDRHRGNEKFVDSRIPILIWKRRAATLSDSDIKTVFFSYSMHPVCMLAHGVSADWPGAASSEISASLQGNPPVFAASGACGNINPPEVGMNLEQMQSTGKIVGTAVLDAINNYFESGKTTQLSCIERFSCLLDTITLPIADNSPEKIIAFVDATLQEGIWTAEFGDKYIRVTQSWRNKMLENNYSDLTFELGIVQFGRIALITVGSEIFAHLSIKITNGYLEEIVNRKTYPQISAVYVIGLTNGSSGYIGVESAYDAGGYEVDESSLFFCLPRLQKGGLEKIATHIVKLMCKDRF